MSDTEMAARRCAYILGPSSASAKAISELDRRRLAGEIVDIVYFRHEALWLVGPPIAAIDVP